MFCSHPREKRVQVKFGWLAFIAFGKEFIDQPPLLSNR